MNKQIQTPQLERALHDIAVQVGKAARLQKQKQDVMKACPKCQFESMEKGLCKHCGYRINNTVNVDIEY